MIYDVYTRELSTNEGRLLKVLNCPLHKRWNELTPMPGDTPQRHCHSCHKSVLDISAWSDDEAERVLSQDPTLCVYARFGAPNLEWQGNFMRRDDPCPFRRIATVYGEHAINKAAEDGFRPLIKLHKFYRFWVKHGTSAQGDKVEIWQNQQTGEIAKLSLSHRRKALPWKKVVGPFRELYRKHENFVAAYLIPEDLHKGERVFLTRLILDRQPNFWNRMRGYRVRRDDNVAYAFWDGSDMVIEKSFYLSTLRYHEDDIG